MPSTIVMETTILFQEEIGPFVLAEGIMQQAGPARHFNCHCTQEKFSFSQPLTVK